MFVTLHFISTALATSYRFLKVKEAGRRGGDSDTKEQDSICTLEMEKGHEPGKVAPKRMPAPRC